MPQVIAGFKFYNTGVLLHIKNMNPTKNYDI